MENIQKRALGKGLSALIPKREVQADQQPKEGVLSLEIEKIIPNRFQPRQNIDQRSLNELVSSIREKGVVQPIIVRHAGSGFELIAGERRLQALKALGEATVPAIVKDVDDAEALQISLIENIQRDQLNAIEEARAFKRLMDEFEFTQEKIANSVGKDNSSISNTIRLLNLPQKIQDYIQERKISSGHARALLSVEDAARQMELCEKIIREGLSVRSIEALARKPRLKKPRQMLREKDIDTAFVEEKLQQILGTKVNIIRGKKRGKIVIEYYSKEELERIIKILGLT